jgi:hypothetical protein
MRRPNRMTGDFVRVIRCTTADHTPLRARLVEARAVASRMAGGGWRRVDSRAVLGLPRRGSDRLAMGGTI